MIAPAGAVNRARRLRHPPPLPGAGRDDPGGRRPDSRDKTVPCHGGEKGRGEMTD
jgi:hypothetical protein